jgi:hypothetical protein
MTNLRKLQKRVLACSFVSRGRLDSNQRPTVHETAARMTPDPAQVLEETPGSHNRSYNPSVARTISIRLRKPVCLTLRSVESLIQVDAPLMRRAHSQCEPSASKTEAEVNASRLLLSQGSHPVKQHPSHDSSQVLQLHTQQSLPGDDPVMDHPAS